ncbi:MAG: hypothetical protein QMD46_01975 [Methanomicrobiales archaeon]|nr:hypothetical protein [Methanomicrobiales archaeon]MDI6875209.1 hypothetical protein [Methanomicrobiales archaeon]
MQDGVVVAHLDAAEKVYPVRILNKQEIAEWIASRLQNAERLHRVITALYSWLSMTGARGDIRIPRDVVIKAVDESA